MKRTELNFSASVSSFLPAGCLCPVQVGSRRWARLLASWADVFEDAAGWRPPRLPRWNPTETSTKPLRPVCGTTLQPSFGYWETGSNGIEILSCLTFSPTSLCLHCRISLFFPRLPALSWSCLLYSICNMNLHKKTESIRQTVET